MFPNCPGGWNTINPLVRGSLSENILRFRVRLQIRDMAALLPTLFLPLSLVLPPPQPAALVQRVSAQQTFTGDPQSFIFPTTSLLATNAKIEAAKAAQAAKLAERGVTTEVVTSAPKGVASAKPCPDVDTLLSMGSSTSGKMISKSCSAQLNQQMTMRKAEKAAEMRAAARELAREEAIANGEPPPGSISFKLF